MDPIELLIDMTEELVRELLWLALAPEAIVMTGALRDALAREQSIRGISIEGYQLTGISVTAEPSGMRAELAYTPIAGADQAAPDPVEDTA